MQPILDSMLSPQARLAESKELTGPRSITVRRHLSEDPFESGSIKPDEIRHHLTLGKPLAYYDHSVLDSLLLLLLLDVASLALS